MSISEPPPTRTIVSRLADNDPALTSATVDTETCLQYAEALKGNTHISTLRVQVGFEDSGGESDDEMASWNVFCQAAQKLYSLRQLVIRIDNAIGDNEPTLDNFNVVGLLIQSSRQIRELHLGTTGDSIRNPVYGGVLADGIAGHPTLESFRIEDFDCSRNESSLAILLGALVTAPNLKSLDLDPRYEGYDQQPGSFPVAEECSNNLGRLLCQATLRSVKFRHFEFTESQVTVMTDAVGSPDSHLQELAFECCVLPVSSMQSFFTGIARSTSIQGLSLTGVRIGDYGRNSSDANLFEPLSLSLSLKSLHLSLQTENGEAWPYFSFLQSNSVLESLSVYLEYSPGSEESIASIFGALGGNKNSTLSSLEVYVCLGDFNVNLLNLLAPLASNRSLKKLSIVLDCDREDAGWPRFDFLRENRTLQRLAIQDWSSLPGEGFESLCQVLRTNCTLETLDLSHCNLEDVHSSALAETIDKNTGLREIVVGYNKFTREGHFTLLPALIRNRNLRVLDLASWRPLGGGTDAFLRHVLSDTHLREVKVSPWDAEDEKPLLMIAAQNHRIERVEFAYNSSAENFPILKGTMEAITKLNKAGRRYLGDRTKGPECKAAGVNVLSKVSNDLDCIFYHLRENPLLCDLGEGVRASNECHQGPPTTTTMSHQESDAMEPVRSSKKRRIV